MSALISSEIAFENVGFSYGEKSVLEDISFGIEKGGYVGICGSTGSGKSTLLKLLLGFYAPGKGSIKIDDRLTTEISSNELRDLFGYVGQDVFLFDGSLRENICYGSDNVDEESLAKVIKQTRLDELVGSLEEGLETMIGERGIKLSGGQRQRVSIARAILKDAPVLVLDEATSAVDNETEKFIKDEVEKLSGDKTIISIAHRLSTIRHADKIFVLENGRLKEEGSHDQLISLSGIYDSLWKIQTGEV